MIARIARRLVLAAPAIILARPAAALMPFLFGANAASASAPVLDQLSGGTTVIGAWSTARKLKTGATGPFYSSTVGGAASNLIGFQANGITDTSTLTTANMALYGGAGGNTSRSWLDQTGNGNHLGRGNPNSLYCAITTGAGALNGAITVTGGASVPTLSMQFAGLSAGNNGPYVSCNALPSNVMAVSFGAVATFWMFAVLKLIDTSPQGQGRIASFFHTGDANDFSTSTSADILSRINTTGGSLNMFAGNSARALGSITNNTLVSVGMVADGTNTTVYASGTAGTPVAYTNTLGAGGNFAIGDTGNAGVFGTSGCKMQIAEMIIGTTLASADRTLLVANQRAFYGV